jgi:hypothetical protein
VQAFPTSYAESIMNQQHGVVTKEPALVPLKRVERKFTHYVSITTLQIYNDTSKENKIKSAIKTRALQTTETPSEIICRNVSVNTQNLFINNTKFESLIDGITKIRKRKNCVLKERTSILEEFKTTLNDEKFIFYDNTETNQEKLAIFTTHLNLIHLKNSKVWVCDGTFYSCPKEFYQLNTIQGLVRGKFYPLVYRLMEKATRTLYDVVFKFLAQKQDIHPEFIIIDFECAPIVSLTGWFSASRITGCFFHFSQTLWRNSKQIK